MRPRTVYITGASSGIGRALALEYARRGARVAIAARRRELLEEVALTAGVAQTVVIPVDVADAEAAQEAVRRAERDLGSLDMVIANAGIGQSQHAAHVTLDSVRELVAVNVTGAFATLLAAIPLMLLEQRGQLVGITSLAGRRGLPKTGAYSASKAALSTFLETLRLDLAPSGIRVTDVRPGFVDTPMIEGRDHPTPFAWTAERAARTIVTRLERAPSTLAFPWPLVALTTFARLLPDALYDRIVMMSPAARD